MIFIENGHYLDVHVSEDVFNKIPNNIIWEDKLDHCFILGNCFEIKALESVLNMKGLRDCFCFDWIRIYKKEDEVSFNCYRSYENYKLALIDNIHASYGDIDKMSTEEKEKFLKIIKSVLP